MKFLTLKIDNFLTIGNAAELSLDDKGLVLIQGVNEDDSSATSNGVGKSSIVDALCWAIYGQTARDESGDAVVNNTAKKNCSVRVMLQDGSTIYRITRYRKHKEFKNQTVVESATEGGTGVWIDMSKGTEKETQEVINGIMGCSLDVFMAAIYAGQESMPDLPKMTDRQLKLLIEESAGVERLETAYTKAREKWSGAKSSLERAQGELENFKTRLHSQGVAIATEEIKHKDFETNRSTRRDSILESNKKLRDQIAAIYADLKSADEEAIKGELEKLNAQMEDHARVVAVEREHVGKVSAAKTALARAEQAVEAAVRDAARTKAVIENAPEEMKKPCPECGKPHTEDELADFCAAQKEKLLGQVAHAKTLRADVDAARTALTAAEQGLATHREGMPDVTEVTARHRDLTAQMTNIGHMKSRMQVLKRDFDHNKELAERAMSEANPYQSAIDVLIKGRDDLMARIEAHEKVIGDLESKASLYESCVKVFGPAGVRAHILDSVTPFLNERTADYLSALSDGNISAVWSTLSTTAKGELREKFSIDVENEKGAKSFKGLSGGEKRKVRLATMLALQDLVASRAVKPIDLWVGDEIDDALDVAGLERLMGVLERKARERGTVIVVSHAELRDWCDQVAVVTKRGGLSTIEGALCD